MNPLISTPCSPTKLQTLHFGVGPWHCRTPEPLSWSFKSNFIVLKILWSHYDLCVLKTFGTFSFLHVIIYPRQSSNQSDFPCSLCWSQLLPSFVYVYLSNPGAIILILLLVTLIVIFTFSENLLPFHCNRRHLIFLLVYYVPRNLQIIDINFPASLLVHGLKVHVVVV